MNTLLTKFCDFYKDNTFFIYKKLGEIENTCYPESDIMVIDYDEVKRSCISNFTRCLKDFQSCDAMKVLESEIDFIEMKSLQKYLEHYSSENREKMLTKDFAHKFEDSILIFKLLLKASTLCLTNEQIKDMMNSLRYYIVLIDIQLNTPDEFLARLDFLANPINDQNKINEITSKILGDLHNSEKQFPIKTKLMFNEELKFLYSA
jgi:hypothetical protein